MSKWKLITSNGYRYSGSHTFATPQKALARLRKLWRDDEMEFATDPNEPDAAELEIYTKLCGNWSKVGRLLRED
jgi:hypothetical protein